MTWSLKTPRSDFGRSTVGANGFGVDESDTLSLSRCEFLRGNVFGSDTPSEMSAGQLYSIYLVVDIRSRRFGLHFAFDFRGAEGSTPPGALRRFHRVSPISQKCPWISPIFHAWCFALFSRIRWERWQPKNVLNVVKVGGSPTLGHYPRAKGCQAPPFSIDLS